MIQSIAVSRHRILRNLIHFCKGMEKTTWSIADTIGKIISHITQSLRYYSRWVGKVKDLYIRRSVFFCKLTIFYQSRHRTHSKRKPCRTGSFLPQNPQIQSYSFILDTHIILSNANRCYDIICIFNGFYRVAGKFQLQVWLQTFCNLLCHFTIDIKLLWIIIHKDHLVDPQFQTALSKAFCQKHRTYSTTADYCYFHL